MAVTTGRAEPPPAATGAENPSAAPVLISSALLGSRARERRTTGAGPYMAAGARSGAIRRTRTGAAGAGGAEDAAGEEEPVAGMLVDGGASAARWTVEGPGTAGAGEPAMGDESTGIAGVPSGCAGAPAGPDGTDDGEEDARPDGASCPGPMAPGRGRRRSPSRGAPS
ncbi:hypothetical protein ACFYZN_36910 [Streptomyces sp. NPDC001777]|uniref:hypothetical protein n=1 Tax=Streptomyces sp. NPDC001777 TaxID=3364608 RepID=UPI00367D681F